MILLRLVSQYDSRDITDLHRESASRTEIS